MKTIHEDSPVERHTTVTAPDISRFLLTAYNKVNSSLFRRALEAEQRGETNPEIEMVLDIIIGTKLLAILRGESEVGIDAEELCVRAAGGDEESKITAAQAIEVARQHDDACYKNRIDQRNSSILSLLGEEEGAAYLRVEERRNEKLSYGNLSIVHATKYEPVVRSNGTRSIQSLFDATGMPRTTVHVALNHHVESSSFSSFWDSSPIVIVAPMDETVSLNGDPTTMIAHDTWWETPPHCGLVLPEDTIIVRPSSDAALDQGVTGGEILYKSDGYNLENLDEFFDGLTDYELWRLKDTLRINLGYFEKIAKDGVLRGTNLQLMGTYLQYEQKTDIRQKIKERFESSDDESFQDACASVAKLVAVRKALGAQNRDYIQPRTTMDSNFMSEEISNELMLMAHHRGMEGHHSESPVGVIERQIRTSYDEDGRFIGTNLPFIQEAIRDNIGSISINTLKMYYRLGLI